MDKSKLSIVIIDDHAVMRNGLASWFTATGRWSIAGTASSLTEAKELFCPSDLIEPSLTANVMLLDIELKDGWGLDIIPWLGEQDIPCPLVAVYSNFEEYAYVKLAFDWGAGAYISKVREESEVEAALNCLIGGDVWIDPRVLTKSQSVKGLIDLLSPREFEILILIKKGLNNKQIADVLDIGFKTVENHISNMYDKTGIHSRLELQKL
ncbi:MAG: response regulator transcription factor [Spirochaetaceae bacterium]|jgi:DNA-binding NarL/FixJ family response regulator|nr:response regulator transcription factor [Spirochaetaceae bacterium]